MSLSSSLLRLSVAILIVCGIFFFVPTQYNYYGIFILIGVYSILGNEVHMILAITAFLLFGVLAVFSALSNAVLFFINIWGLMTPNGPNASWSVILPQYFWVMIPIAIGFMLIAIGATGLLTEGWADQYLAMAFSKLMIRIFIIFTILNCLFIFGTLYTALSTTTWMLFVWELIFTWLPFFTLAFIVYYFLGRIFDREERSEREYRDRVDRLEKHQKKELKEDKERDKKEKQERKREKERNKHNEQLKHEHEQNRKKGGHR
jgi:hypothetical protein